MSLANIQDSLVKTHLVQQVQARGGEIARTQEQAQLQHQRELAREADEVVLSMKRGAEKDEIRDDEERDRNGQPRRRRQEGEDQPEDGDERKEAEAQPSESSRRVAPPLGPPPAPAVGSRKLDYFV